MRETQSRKFATSNKLSVYFCLPEFIATNITSWRCQVDNSTTGRYGTILGRYLLTVLVLDTKFSEDITICSKGPYEG